MALIEKVKKAPEQIVMQGGKVAIGGVVGETLIDGFTPPGLIGILVKGVIGGYAGTKIDKMFGLGILGSAGKDVIGMLGGVPSSGNVGTGASRWL